MSMVTFFNKHTDSDEVTLYFYVCNIIVCEGEKDIRKCHYEIYSKKQLTEINLKNTAATF